MTAFIKRLWAWITGWLWWRAKPLRTVQVEESPDALKPNTIYIAGENEYLWFAAMLCPCGCGGGTGNGTRSVPGLPKELFRFPKRREILHERPGPTALAVGPASPILFRVSIA